MMLSGMAQNFVAKNTQVRKVVRHPFTQVALREVFVEGKGWYAWDTDMRTYVNESRSRLMVDDMQRVNYEARLREAVDEGSIVKSDFTNVSAGISKAVYDIKQLQTKCNNRGRGDLSIALKDILDQVTDAGKSVDQIVTQKVK